MACFAYRLFAFSLLYALSTGRAQASHDLAAELSYQYAGTAAAPYQYRVIARFKTDGASAVAPPTQVQLTCNPNGCITGPGIQYITLTTATPPTTTITGCAPLSRYYDATLTGLVNLLPAHWRLSIELSLRSSGVHNLPTATTNGTVVVAELDNTLVVANSSPRFTATRQVRLPNLLTQHYSFNAFDPDGDSLSYELVQPQVPTYSLQPCGAPSSGALAPYFQLNSTTGDLQLTPGAVQQGTYVMAGRVNEFRRVNGAWQRIGSIWRDEVYYLTSSTNQVPVFTSVLQGTAPRLGQPIAAVAGQPTELLLTATDSDAGQLITLSSEAVGIVPGLALQPQAGGQARLVWQVPATLNPGRYTVAVTAVDNACARNAHTVLTLTFVVQRPLATATARLTLVQPPYPTPFAQDVQFQLAGAGVQAVAVVDATGRTVAQLRSAPDGRVRWQPAAGLAPGLYVARTADGRQVARLAYAGH